MCKKVWDLVYSDRRIQVEEIVQALGISHGSVSTILHRVLTRILKIGVKCCRPEKFVLPYFFIGTFQKVGVRNEKLE